MASSVPASELTTVSAVNAASLSICEREKADKGGGSAVELKDQALSTKQKKEKTSKAERRAIQEAQQAAKAAAKGNKASGTLASVNVKPAKAAKPPQKVDNTLVAASEKKGGDPPPEKKIERKMFLNHTCNMMIRAEWRKPNGLLW